jgi:unsaturated rhamnogalacturonyl hydrolase
MALRKRYVSKEYEDMAIKAAKAVIAQIDKKGELQNTSFDTGVCDPLQFYKDIPRNSLPYSQANSDHSTGGIFEEVHMTSQS